MDLQVQNVAFFTTFSGLQSIEIYMDLQVQKVAFFVLRDRSEGGGGSLWLSASRQRGAQLSEPAPQRLRQK